MKTTTLTVSSLIALTLSSATASASISSVSGSTVQNFAPNPASCVLGALTGFTAYAWDEAQNRSAFSLSVDMTNNPGASSGPIPGVISGPLDSHFIHFEGMPGAIGVSGSVTFNNPIVGVNLFAASLDATDGPYGAPLTTYPTFFPFRDLTFNTSSFNIVGNTINFNLDNFSPVLGVVQLRIFTQAPAPGSVGLAGLAGLAALRRRRANS